MCMRCGHSASNNDEKCPLCGVDFNEVEPEKIGRIPNFGKKRKIQKEFEKKYDTTIDELEKKLNKKNFFKANDIFGEGVAIQLFLPEKEIIIKQRSGLTKGVATLGLGLVGLAATSGVKQQTKTKSIHTRLQVVDAGIILKNASPDKKDIRIPFENVKSLEYISKQTGHCKLILLENQTLIFYLRIFLNRNQKEELLQYVPEVKEQVFKVINERAKGNEDPEEIKWSTEKSDIIKTIENNQENPSLMDELERLGNMYKEGLLTEDEFALAKKKLLGQ